jgi:hypothetical protein
MVTWCKFRTVDPQIVSTQLYNLISTTPCLSGYVWTRLNSIYSILVFLNRQSTHSLAGGRVNLHKQKKFCFKMNDTLPLIGDSAKLRKGTIRFVMSVRPSFCLSVCLTGTPRLPLEGFSWNLKFWVFFLKIC